MNYLSSLDGSRKTRGAWEATRWNHTRHPELAGWTKVRNNYYHNNIVACVLPYLPKSFFTQYTLQSAKHRMESFSKIWIVLMCYCMLANFQVKFHPARQSIKFAIRRLEQKEWRLQTEEKREKKGTQELEQKFDLVWLSKGQHAYREIFVERIEWITSAVNTWLGWQRWSVAGQRFCFDLRITNQHCQQEMTR